MENDVNVGKIRAMKKAAIYARVSTANQNTENQIRELRDAAQKMNFEISYELIDDGISGAKGRSERQAFDQLFKLIQRREIDVVMAWSIDRLGRSITDLVNFMNEVNAANVDLYVHQQSINTATPAGRMIFGIFSALGEYERELITERVKAGLARAKAEGKKLGRPSNINEEQKTAVIDLRVKGYGINKIAKTLKIGVGKTSKILKAA